ncbi:MAG: helix-turn-helix domain-containing protein [Saprospiraceae bacterium]|nr:helix-turn-helix domain-containing protein [Saprospiraceae bacterium]
MKTITPLIINPFNNPLFALDPQIGISKDINSTYLLCSTYFSSNPSIFRLHSTLTKFYSNYNSLIRSHLIINNLILFVSEFIGNERLITLNDISKNICISEIHLYKTVRKELGISPRILLQDYYVSQIIILYISYGLSIKEITEKLGFQETSSLCHFFKRKSGYTISALKKIQNNDLNSFSKVSNNLH